MKKQRRCIISDDFNLVATYDFPFKLRDDEDKIIIGEKYTFNLDRPKGELIYKFATENLFTIQLVLDKENLHYLLDFASMLAYLFGQDFELIFYLKYEGYETEP